MFVQRFRLLPVQVWQALTESVLTPEQPFKLHQLLLSIVSEHWDAVRQVVSIALSVCK